METIMHMTHYHLSTFVGLAAILSAGCDYRSTGPVAEATGAIEVTVVTTSADIDLDPDGYSLMIDDRPSQAIGANAIVTIGALSTGRHLIGLDGVAANCTAGSLYRRYVDVTADKAALISFTVTCTPQSDGDSPWDY
jgi:uncharacterized metal-binding protein